MARKRRGAARRSGGRAPSPRKAAAATAQEEVPETEENVENNLDLEESEVATDEGQTDEGVEVPPPSSDIQSEEEETNKSEETETATAPEPVAGPSRNAVPPAIAGPSGTAAPPAIAGPSGAAGPAQIPPEALDDKNNILSEYWSTLSKEKEYLADVTAGYQNEENLKRPLKCFTSDDETQLFPVIETMSAKLYSIVQRMNAGQKRDVEAAIKNRKGVIKIKVPNVTLNVKAYLCHVNSLEPPTEKSATTAKRAPHPFLLTEDENMFSDEKLAKLRAVLDAGWKREVVMRSPGSTGRKTGDVYYYSPTGTKFRSSKQVAQYLAQRKKDNPFTIDNFSFAKVRISTNPEQEIVRKAYDGSPPRRSPPKPAPAKGKAVPQSSSKGESSKSVTPKPSTSTAVDVDSRAEEPVKGVSSRRSIQPPKRYSGDAVLLLSKRPKMQDDKRNSSSNKGLMQMGMLPPKYPKGMEDTSSNLSETPDYSETGSIHEDGSISGSSIATKELADDSLFQISAMRVAGGIDVEKMHQLVEQQKKMAAMKQSGGRPGPRPGGRPTPGGSKGGQSVIPCSIRCPGMTGVVPNLQCTRCLCLFHAECLGLPPNLLFKQYLCSNCTDQGSAPSSAAPAAAGSANSQKHIMKKPSDIKRGPPEMLPLPHRRGPVPGRDITVTIAGKEHMGVRMPQRGAPPQPGMVRGMVRPRGGPVGHHIRSPGQQQQRMIVSESSTVTAVPSMNANQLMMRRGRPVRGRPPGVPVSRMPPQINKNLTITQLPRLHGALPVPNLQPMRTPRPPPSKVPIPQMVAAAAGGRARQVIPVPNLIKSNAFRVAVPPPSLSGRTFKKVSPPVSHQAPSNLRAPYQYYEAPKGIKGYAANRTPPGMYSTVPDRSIPMVKRCPQSVCVIGNQKFVVLPKKAPNSNNREFVPATTVTVTPVGNGGLSKGNYTISETTMRAPPVKRVVDNDVTVTEHVKVYRNSDGSGEVSNGQQNDSTNIEDEDVASADDEQQVQEYGDNENSHNFEEHEENDNNDDDNNEMEIDESNSTVQEDGVMAEAVSAE